MKARRKLDATKLSVGFPAHRDETVLDCSGNRTESCQYAFLVDGGTIGTKVFGRRLPFGAIVTGIKTDEIVAVTGATDITLFAGTQALTGTMDFTASAGIQTRALAGAVAGIKITSTTAELNIAIATAAATAGQIRFYISYLLPTDLTI